MNLPILVDISSLYYSFLYAKDAFTLVSPVTVLDYFTVGKGPLSSNGGAVGNAFVHTKVKF